MKTEYLFYFCDGMGSVFDSQVLSLLRGIYERDEFKKIYLFLGIKSEEQKNYYLSSKSTPEIETVFYKSSPNYPFFNLFVRKSLRNTLTNLNIDFRKVLIHTRGEMIAWHLSKILGKKYHKNIIPDIRGTSIEEIKEFYNLNKLQKLVKINNNIKALQKLNRFTKISVVSGSLKEYLVKNYNVNPEKIFITHSLAGKEFTFNEELRKKVRNELNLNEKDLLIVFSSGGTANWQNNDPLNWLADKGFKVLNLSKKELRHINIINKFVSYSEMPEYLNAADAAIIWRDKSIVNQAASPVKFSEYICCGLPVIANNSVDMIAEYIKEHNCGLLIDSFDELEEKAIRDLKQKDRNKISEEGIFNFGIDAIADKYISTYTSINSL
ncbi:MAG: glycosyltransferase [Ignavibacteriaceae bacterium]